jgi:hypothetical protein
MRSFRHFPIVTPIFARCFIGTVPCTRSGLLPERYRYVGLTPYFPGWPIREYGVSVHVNCLQVRRDDPPETGGDYRIGDYIVRTARNRALPSATRS